MASVTSGSFKRGLRARAFRMGRPREVSFKYYTAHANSCRHLLWRLETMAMMSDVDLPAAHIRNQVAAAIDIVVHLARLRGGRRVVWEIAAVEGTRRGEPVVTPVFRFRPRAGADGHFEATGT